MDVFLTALVVQLLPQKVDRGSKGRIHSDRRKNPKVDYPGKSSSSWCLSQELLPYLVKQISLGKGKICCLFFSPANRSDAALCKLKEATGSLKLNCIC